MTPELEQQLSKLGQGEHLCPIHENMAESMACAVFFMKDGLARGECCLYVADDPTVDKVFQMLGATGVDVAHERARGALRSLIKRETFLQSGEFDPQAMIDILRSAASGALADGFSGARVIAEKSWTMGPRITCERLVEYEVRLQQILPNSRIVLICQYDRESFSPTVINDVLLTHPRIVLGDLVCPNPFYEPPDLVQCGPGQSASELMVKRVDWRIRQLREARREAQERERALEKLKQSERRLAEAKQIAHIGSWERDLRTNRVTWSDELYRLFGLESQPDDLSYQQFLNLISPQDVDRVRECTDQAIRERRPFSCDYQITRADGSVRVLHDRGSVILNEAGEPIRLVGTAQDVTELRQAERALQEYAARLKALSRRLLEVQEEERRHLARELHDEFGQFLATITLHLHAARGLAGAAALPGLDECATLLQQAGEQVRTLALELRPTMLDTLGLEATLRWLAEHHQQFTGCEVQVVAHRSEAPLPSDLTIACFRVAQEALTNVVRHAAARHVWIELSQSENVLELVIRDDGMGFDVAPTQEQAARRGSLGLLGMAERVQLLAGSLHVESKPGGGTSVRASFPLSKVSKQPGNPAE